jgi:MFS transporter, DHA1 family, inner membrane transport protein
LRKSSIRERSLLWLLAGIQLTLLLDFMVLMPLGPQLMRELGINAKQFGGLVSCYTLASALFGMSGVFWLGRCGRRRTLLVLYAGFMLATLACGAATGALWLLAARIAAGACAGPLWAVVMDVIVDVVPEERRGAAMGVVMSSYAVSAVAGVPLGLWAAGWLGFAAPFWWLTVASAGLWLVAFRWLPAATVVPTSEPAPAAAALRQLFRDPQLFAGWGLTFFVVSAGFLLIPYLGAFFVGNLGVRADQLGVVYLCGGVATFFSSRLVGGAVDRWGPGRSLGTLLVASAVPHLLVTQLVQARFAAVIASFVLFMTLTSGRMIPTMVLLTSRVAPGLRARYLAVNTAVSDAASGSAAWLAGSLLTTLPDGRLLGFDRVGLLAICVSGAALLLLGLLLRSTRSRTAADADEALPGTTLSESGSR